MKLGPLDFDLHAGEIVTVMGPSGVGKTSLLLTLLGFQEARLSVRGVRKFNGTELTPGSVPVSALYIPQNQPFNTNWEIEAFLCRLPWGRGRLADHVWPRRRKRLSVVRSVLKRLDLDHRGRATVAELSGGETQRAALAQMMLLKPRFLVGDEFVGALDPGMTVWVLDECRRLLAEAGGAGMVALHDVHAALHVSDRILLLWPPSISTSPWVIKVGGTAWECNRLHAALCLARWTMDVAPNAAVQQFVSVMHRLFEEETALGETLCRFKDASIAVVDEFGHLNAVEQFEVGGQRLQEATRHEPGIRPLRFDVDQTVALGCTFPRNGREPFQLIAVGKTA